MPVSLPAFNSVPIVFFLSCAKIEMPVSVFGFFCVCVLLFSSNNSINWSRDACFCTCFFVSMPFIFFQ